MSLCSGSQQAQRGLPDIIVADDGESGTRVHDALADDPVAYSKLSSDELTVFEEMGGKARKMAERFEFNPEKFESHVRLWFDEEFSGEFDRMYRTETRALICDFKSGWLTVTDSAENPQLAALAILAIRNYHVAEVVVGIIPRMGKVPEPAVYNLESATAALEKIREIIARAEMPDAPRVAGDKQCKYCKARTSCPEFQAYASVALSVQKDLIPALPADRLALAIDRIPAANTLIAALKAEAKRRIAENDPEFIKLYGLSEGRNVREIVKLPDLFARVQPLGVTVDQFTAACSMNIGGVKKGVAKGFVGLVHMATGLKGKSLDDKSETLLEGFVEVSKTQGSLERKEAPDGQLQ